MAVEIVSYPVKVVIFRGYVVVYRRYVCWFIKNLQNVRYFDTTTKFTQKN